MGATSLSGEFCLLLLLFKFNVNTCFFFRVIFALIAGFMGLRGPLWTLIFVYAFLANAFFLVGSYLFKKDSH